MPSDASLAPPRPQGAVAHPAGAATGRDQVDRARRAAPADASPAETSGGPPAWFAADALAAAKEARPPRDRPSVLVIPPGPRVGTGGEYNIALLSVGLAAMGFPTATLGTAGPARDFVVAHGVRDAGTPPAPAGCPAPQLAAAASLAATPARLAELAASLADLGDAVARYRRVPRPDRARAVATHVDRLADSAELIATLGHVPAAWPDGWPREAADALRIRHAMRQTHASVCVADLAEHAAAAAVALAGRPDQRLVWYLQNSIQTAEDAWLAEVATPVAVHASVLAMRMPACRHAQVAQNGVNMRRFVPLSPGARDTAAPLRIGNVGTLDGRKNQALLIRAVARAGRPLADAEVWLVGEGAARVQLARLAAETGLGARVRFLGNRHDVPELLRTFDIFAFPSRTEGLSLSLAEAMACGVAIVASDLPGTGAIAAPEAILLPPDDVDAWATALVALAADPADRRRRGLAGRAQITALGLTHANMLTQFAAALAAARPLPSPAEKTIGGDRRGHGKTVADAAG